MDESGATIIKEFWPHTVNVVAHVFCGILILALGLVQLVARKGDQGHARRGLWFLRATWGSVTTAVIGIVVFNFSAFLAVITMLVAYWAFSGYRTLAIRDRGPGRADAIGSLLALAAAATFVFYISNVRFPWAPEVIYSTLATMFTIATYDLVRFAFPRRWFSSLWLPEHIVKMTGAFSAALAAFSGTVLGAWQPYSQTVPSAVMTLVTIGFVVYYVRQSAMAKASTSSET